MTASSLPLPLKSPRATSFAVAPSEDSVAGWVRIPPAGPGCTGFMRADRLSFAPFGVTISGSPAPVRSPRTTLCGTEPLAYPLPGAIVNVAGCTGVTTFETAAGPVPVPLVAATWKLYAVPSVSPPREVVVITPVALVAVMVTACDVNAVDP